MLSLNDNTLLTHQSAVCVFVGLTLCLYTRSAEATSFGVKLKYQTVRSSLFNFNIPHKSSGPLVSIKPDIWSPSRQTLLLLLLLLLQEPTHTNVNQMRMRDQTNTVKLNRMSKN